MSELEKVVDVIKQEGAEKIILFGSHAYGKPKKDSDIDILVIKKTSLSFHARLKNLRMKVQSTTPFDFFIFTPREFEKAKKSNPFVAEIAEKGKVIYEQ